MTHGEIAARAREIQRIVLDEPTDARSNALWKQSLDICGLSENSELLALDFELGSHLVVDQVKEIAAAQPLPENLTFIYFGLYDSPRSEDPTETSGGGFYFAGGTAPNYENALENGDLTYFPQKRRLHLTLLDKIIEEVRRAPKERQALDYLLPLAATAVVTRNVANRLGICVPAFVGFDSGDYFQVTR